MIEGGHYRNIADVLARADLAARSLFLEHRDPGIVAAGPFLVPLDARKLGRLLRIEGIDAACVFWGGDVAEPVLFRHLRSLNLTEIPRPADAPHDPFAPAADSVLLRHWDPSVMALLVPVLEPAQRARVFGPMARLVLFDAASGRALEATARADWPPPARGFLRMSPEQMERIADAMAGGSRAAIAGYLRETAPDQTAAMDDAALLAFVARSEAAGRGWGLRTEAGFGRFAWLMLATGGALVRMGEVRDYVAAPDGRPDRRIKAVMSAVAAQPASHGASS